MTVVFGEATAPTAGMLRAVEPLIGMGWLYAVHVRSSIARGRHLQALHMLNGMREQLTSLLCLRADLEPDQARGVDDLPWEVKDRLVATVAHGIEPGELVRVLTGLTQLLADQIEDSGPSAAALRAVLDEIVRDAADHAS